jgi:hypothetical protein
MERFKPEYPVYSARKNADSTLTNDEESLG